MKYLIFIIIFVSTSTVFSQKMPSDYFDEAYQYYCVKDYSKALEIYKFVISYYPKNYLVKYSSYKSAYIYKEILQYDSALCYLHKILPKNYPKIQMLSNSFYFKNDFNSLDFQSFMLISDIYLEQMKYDSALYYLLITDSLQSNIFYNLRIDGHDYKDYIKLKLAQTYMSLNIYCEALRIILPKMFYGEYQAHFLENELNVLLKDSTNLTNKIEFAFKNAYTKIIKSNYQQDTCCCINFLNSEIVLPQISYYEKDIESSDKYLSDYFYCQNSYVPIWNIEQLRQTDFYQFLKKLDDEQKNSPDNK